MRSIKLQFSLEKPEAPKTTGRKTLSKSSELQSMRHIRKQFKHLFQRERKREREGDILHVMQSLFQ